jgi:hypothetical protein
MSTCSITRGPDDADSLLNGWMNAWENTAESRMFFWSISLCERRFWLPVTFRSRRALRRRMVDGRVLRERNDNENIRL